jgi:hypothetical protein
MAVAVALLGGEASSRATLATALRRALAFSTSDLGVVIDDTPTLAEQCRYDLTLLLGLDPSASPHVEAADAQLRDTLQRAGVAFQIVHGSGEAGVQQALRAFGRLLGRSLVADDPALTLGRGGWRCENCSDPDCERRIFTGLMAQP